MDHKSVDIQWVVDTFLLLLIGVGPKIALVPFLEVTAGMDGATKSRIVRKMLIAAGTVALILVGLGELLTRLLHFETESLSIAGGIILVIIAVTMVLGSADPREGQALKARSDENRRVPARHPVSSEPRRQIDESRMLITEKVFGFLLAAIAVQLILDGLQSVGAIQLSIH